MKTLTKPSLILFIAFAAMSNIGYGAPPPNVVVSDAANNTAMGTDALVGLTDGFDNTASGFEALRSNTTGAANTALGTLALHSNTSGGNNIAIGRQALLLNVTGNANVAIGVDALFNNTTGRENTAVGFSALDLNTSGRANTATGFLALVSNRTGIRNVGIGNNALQDNVAGRNNTAIGWSAGERTTGNDNILIAHKGVTGESQTMRLGVKGTAGVAGSGVSRTYIAGIKGVTTGLAGSPVLIDANGQLGTISSSRRYKEDIQPMGSVSERLFALRPVIFRYKEPNEDGSKPEQFGLIAEEVAKAFPELVIYDEEGKPETVSYHLLATLLLNEFQKEHTRITELEQQSAELAQLKNRVAMMAEVIERLDHERMVATNR